MIRPIIRWLGCKRKIAHTLVEEMLQHSPTRYYEPFCGSCVVGLNLIDRSPNLPATFSDQSPDLINALLQARYNPETLQTAYDLLRRLPSKEDYYYIRDEFIYLEPIFAAARFFYLNAMAHNGLHRVNKEGRFNAPKGDRIEVIPKDFLGWSKNLSGKDITYKCIDAIALIKDLPIKLDESPIIFIDPPYLGKFTGYTSEGYTKEDAEELARVLWQAHEKGYKIWATIGDYPGIRELYQRWADISILEEEFAVGGKKSRRKGTITLLIRAL